MSSPSSSTGRCSRPSRRFACGAPAATSRASPGRGCGCSPWRRPASPPRCSCSRSPGTRTRRRASRRSCSRCLTAIAFGLGLAPPRLLRYAWRMPEQRRLQRAVEALITQASSRDEILRRVLPPMASIVGAESIVFHDASGEAIGAPRGDYRGTPAPRAEPVTVDVDGAWITVQTGPYAPFFGQEELQLLRTLGRAACLRSTASACSTRSARRGSRSSAPTTRWRTSSRSRRTSCGRR